MNFDYCTWRESAEKPQEPVAPERDTACGRRPVGPGDVEKHRAAPPRDARPGVVVDLDDEIVEGVVTPEPVAWFIGRPPERAVVTAVRRVFAPRERAIDPRRRQQRARPPKAIRPPPQPQRPEPAARGRPVAFALVRPDARSSQHDRNRLRPRKQQSPAAAARPRAHADDR